MRLLTAIFIIIFTLTSCGKKSEPEYQGKLNQVKKNFIIKCKNSDMLVKIYLLKNYQ